MHFMNKNLTQTLLVLKKSDPKLIIYIKVLICVHSHTLMEKAIAAKQTGHGGTP